MGGEPENGGGEREGWLQGAASAGSGAGIAVRAGAPRCCAALLPRSEQHGACKQCKHCERCELCEHRHQRRARPRPPRAPPPRAPSTPPLGPAPFFPPSPRPPTAGTCRAEALNGRPPSPRVL